MATEGTAAAMRGAAAAERLRRALAALSTRYAAALQPTADALGCGLGLPDEPINIFSEEVLRPRQCTIAPSRESCPRLFSPWTGTGTNTNRALVNDCAAPTPRLTC